MQADLKKKNTETVVKRTALGLVKKIFLEDSLDSIPSTLPSVEIWIMVGKVGLRCKGKTLLGAVTKLFVEKFGDNTQQC